VPFISDSFLYYYGYAPTDTNGDRCGIIDTEGMFNKNTNYKIADVTDGTSGTMMIGEMSRYRNEPDSFFQPGNLGGFFGGNFGGDYRPVAAGTTVPKLNSQPQVGPPNCMFDTSPIADDQPSWANTPAPYGCVNLGQFGFRSQHPGGGNFAFGDGSVRYIKDSISIPTYRALSTRAGGEVISADSY